MNRRNWTEEETEYLTYTVGKISYSKIASTLNRSIGSVKRKSYSLGLQEKINYTRKNWKQSEKDYIERNYSEKTVKEIAKHLRRTESSVKHQAQRMGIYSEKLVGYSLKEISRSFGCNVSVILRWRDKYGLNVRENKIGDGMYYTVYGEDFWKWALQNRNIVPISSYEKYSILPEPENLFSYNDWKILGNNHHKKITKQDISTIKSLKNRGYTISEISGRVGRSKDSVKHILKDYKV